MIIIGEKDWVFGTQKADPNEQIPVLSIEPECHIKSKKEVIDRLSSCLSIGVINKDTGFLLQASRSDAKKTLFRKDISSPVVKAIFKSAQVIASSAVLIESHADVLHENEKVQAIHIFAVPTRVENTLYRVELTVRDYIEKEHERKMIHSIDGINIKEYEKASVWEPPVQEVASKSTLQKTGQPTNERYKDILNEEIELLDGASAEFDLERVQKGELTPVFFGSALTNFGVEIFLQHFLQMTTTPLPRKADMGLIDPVEHDFSAFVFKIQANMNKAHRDRIAFMRICSGKYDAQMEVKHIQGGKVMRLSQPQQIMASERKILEEAYAGDIIGVFDPGIFSIGDTLCMPKEQFQYEGIPTFAPEHFARVRQMDTMKRKQFVKGITQIAQEGAIQIFQEFNTGMEEIIVGVVGVLQFDVLKYRLENEYNVEIRLENLPYEHIRWIENKEIDLNKLVGTSDMKKIKDLKGNPLLLFVNQWSIGMTLDRNEGLILSEFGRD